jgi:hypothetical protein
MMSAEAPVIVFLGPTLPLSEARTIADALYLPPASQGSVISAVLRHRPKRLLIIDGVFQSEPAVRHKEILWALAEGVTVMGAASIGALRAAELHPFGMVGIGLIYRWFRRYPFAPDDAVAVVHGPAEVASPAETLSLIDLLMTIKAAHRAGAIHGKQHAALARAARNLNFRDRTLENVVAASFVGTSATVLALNLVEQKRQDAIMALRYLAGTKVERTPAHSPFAWTTAFVRDLEHAKITVPIRNVTG